MSESDSHTTFVPPELEEVAALFPSYDVHSLIACGGMGAVFHATQSSLDRGVAIKILPREFSQDEAFREGFEAEAKAMAKLNHPNLIGVYDFGEVDGMLYIVMEYVTGNSLYESVHGHAVEDSEAMKIVINVCRGLANAHEHGILHRDIKPSNILLDLSANPKIGDFGLARPLEREIEHGEQIFGTPGYTAPEVIEPPYTFDHRADIFSVGVMLYELLTGITPDGSAPLVFQGKITNPRIVQFIKRATNPNPNARFASANEMATELEKLAATASNPLLSGATAGAGARRYTPPKPAKKKSNGFRNFVILLLIAGAGYFYKDKIMAVLAGDSKPPVNEESVVIKTPVAKPVPEIVPEVPVIDPKEVVEPVEEPVVKEVEEPIAEDLPERRKTVAEEGVSPIGNVDEFFQKAEDIMKERTAQNIKDFKINIETNTTTFQEKASEAISEIDADSTDEAESALKAALESWEKRDYILPEELPGSLAKFPGISSLYSESLETQLNFRNLFVEKLKKEEAVYILGLEKQIQRYTTDGDKVAVELLKKEIARVNAEPEYFEFLMTN